MSIFRCENSCIFRAALNHLLAVAAVFFSYLLHASPSLQTPEFFHTVPADAVLVTGRISGFSEVELQALELTLTRYTLAGNKIEHLRVNEDGNFSVNWPRRYVVQEVRVRATGLKNPIQAFVRSDLSIDIQKNDGDTRPYSFSGSDGPLNEHYMRENDRLLAAAREARNEYSTLRKKTKDKKINERRSKLDLETLSQHLAALEKIYQTKRRSLDLIKDHHLRELIAKEIDAEYYSGVLHYQHSAPLDLKKIKLIEPLSEFEPIAASHLQIATLTTFSRYIQSRARKSKLPVSATRNSALLDKAFEEQLLILDRKDIDSLYREWKDITRELVKKEGDKKQNELRKQKAREIKSELKDHGFSVRPRGIRALWFPEHGNNLKPSTREIIQVTMLDDNYLLDYIVVGGVLSSEIQSPKLRKYLDDSIRRARNEYTQLVTKSATKSSPKYHSYEGQNAKQIMTAIHKKYHGKALLLDFWGAWCSPCLSDIPHLKKLKTDLANEKIAFVYFSFNTPKKKLENAIARYQLDGHHVWLTSEQEKELLKIFDTRGFPTYHLVNSRGEVLEKAIKRPITIATSQQIRTALEAKSTP